MVRVSIRSLTTIASMLLNPSHHCTASISKHFEMMDRQLLEIVVYKEDPKLHHHLFQSDLTSTSGMRDFLRLIKVNTAGIQDGHISSIHRKVQNLAEAWKDSFTKLDEYKSQKKNFEQDAFAKVNMEADLAERVKQILSTWEQVHTNKDILMTDLEKMRSNRRLTVNTDSSTQPQSSHTGESSSSSQKKSEETPSSPRHNAEKHSSHPTVEPEIPISSGENTASHSENGDKKKHSAPSTVEREIPISSGGNIPSHSGNGDKKKQSSHSTEAATTHKDTKNHDKANSVPNSEPKKNFFVHHFHRIRKAAKYVGSKVFGGIKRTISAPYTKAHSAISKRFGKVRGWFSKKESKSSSPKAQSEIDPTTSTEKKSSSSKVQSEPEPKTSTEKKSSSSKVQSEPEPKTSTEKISSSPNVQSESESKTSAEKKSSAQSASKLRSL